MKNDHTASSLTASVCLPRHYDELHNRLKRIGEPSGVLTLILKCSCLHQVMRSTFMGTLLLGTPICFMQLLLLKSDANRLLRNHSLITLCFRGNVICSILHFPSGMNKSHPKKREKKEHSEKCSHFPSNGLGFILNAILWEVCELVRADLEMQ